MDEVIKGSLEGLVKEVSKDATKAAGETLNKTTKGIGDLFKKK